MHSKQRKCKICGAQFVSFDSFRGFCSPECGVKLSKIRLEKQREKAAKQREREDKARIKAVRERLKTRNDLIKEAQAAVNKYVRLRDLGKKCISCGVPLVAEQFGGGFDAGHYRSRGAASHLRFYTLNIHGQCKKCNRYLGGNYAYFRIGLIERLGLDKVEAIEADYRDRDYSREDLVRIKRIFGRKARLLERRRG